MSDGRPSTASICWPIERVSRRFHTRRHSRHFGGVFIVDRILAKYTHNQVVEILTRWFQSN